MNGHYAYIFHFDHSEFAGITTERFIEAMGAEGIPSQAAYPEVHKLDMFQNGAYKSRLSGAQASEEHAFLQADFPNSHRAATEGYWVPQYCLLGDEQDMEEIAAAIRKIHAGATSLV